MHIQAHTRIHMHVRMHMCMNNHTHEHAHACTHTGVLLFINFTFCIPLGDQGKKWINTQVFVGRQRYPFTLDIVAYNGGGDGGIGVDEFNFVDCKLPPKCDAHSNRKFRYVFLTPVHIYDFIVLSPSSSCMCLCV